MTDEELCNEDGPKALAQWVLDRAGVEAHCDENSAGDSCPFVTHPSGHKLTSLREIQDGYRTEPVRHKGTSTHETIDSLIAHVQNWKAFGFPVAGAVAFAAFKPAQITVIYDYDKSSPNWRDHRASYAFPQSPDFVKWLGVFGCSLSTEALAELLEDRLADVVTPDVALASGVMVPAGMRLASPAELLTLATGLQLNVTKTVRDIKRRDNGTADLSYEEEHAVKDSKGASITVPNGFVLALEPFVDGDRFAVPVRLRYKLTNNVIRWTLTPHNLDNAVRDAVRRECKRFADGTGLKLFWGAPESPATVR